MTTITEAQGPNQDIHLVPPPFPTDGVQGDPDWAAWNEFQTFRARWCRQNQDTPNLAAFRQEYQIQHQGYPQASTSSFGLHQPQRQGLFSQNATSESPYLCEGQSFLVPPVPFPRPAVPLLFSLPSFLAPTTRSLVSLLSIPTQVPPLSYPSQAIGHCPPHHPQYPPPGYPHQPYPFPSFQEGIPYQYRRASSSPFVMDIEQYQLPQGTRLPTLKSYNGTTDPDDHIENYRWMMKAHYLDPRFWCTYFVTTLNGSARSWFKSLSPCSIKDFEQLEEEFLANFIQQKKFNHDPQALLGCRQRKGETTHEYFTRFNKATLQAPGRDDSMIVAAFTYGLKEGPLFRKLVGKPSKTRKELMERVTRYLRQEEAVREKSKIERGSGDRKPSTPDKPISPDGNHYRTEQQKGSHPRSQPFNSRRELLAIVDGRDSRKEKTTEKLPSRDNTKYCEYHSVYGHDTIECSTLHKEVKQRLRSRKLEEEEPNKRVREFL